MSSQTTDKAEEAKKEGPGVVEMIEEEVKGHAKDIPQDIADAVGDIKKGPAEVAKDIIAVVTAPKIDWFRLIAFAVVGLVTLIGGGGAIAGIAYALNTNSTSTQ